VAERRELGDLREGQVVMVTAGSWTQYNNSLTNSLIYLLLKILMAECKGPFDRLCRSPLALIVLLRRAIADLVDFDNGIFLKRVVVFCEAL